MRNNISRGCLRENYQNHGSQCYRWDTVVQLKHGNTIKISKQIPQNHRRRFLVRHQWHCIMIRMYHTLEEHPNILMKEVKTTRRLKQKTTSRLAYLIVRNL